MSTRFNAHTPFPDPDRLSSFADRLRQLSPAEVEPDPPELYYRAGYAAALAQRSKPRFAIWSASLMAATLAAAIVGPVGYRWGRGVEKTPAVAQTAGAPDPVSDSSPGDERTSDAADPVDPGPAGGGRNDHEPRSVKPSAELGPPPSSLSSWNALAGWWRLWRGNKPRPPVPLDSVTLTANPVRWEPDVRGIPSSPHRASNDRDSRLPSDFGSADSRSAANGGSAASRSAPPTLQARDWGHWEEFVGVPGQGVER